MKWYTCIVHNPSHISPVQWFHTRAETPEQAEANALNWVFNGDPNMANPDVRDGVEVPLVFEGRLEPVSK